MSQTLISNLKLESLLFHITSFLFFPFFFSFLPFPLSGVTCRQLFCFPLFLFFPFSPSFLSLFFLFSLFFFLFSFFSFLFSPFFFLFSFFSFLFSLFYSLDINLSKMSLLIEAELILFLSVRFMKPLKTLIVL